MTIISIVGHTGAARKVHVLIVDDDHDTFVTLSHGLSRHNLKVTAYSDPREALLQFKPDFYDIVLLDIEMSGIPGFEVAKRIWKQDPDAKIWFFSALEVHEKETKVVVNDLKSVRFVRKTISPAELAQEVIEFGGA